MLLWAVIIIIVITITDHLSEVEWYYYDQQCLDTGEAHLYKCDQRPPHRKAEPCSSLAPRSSVSPGCQAVSVLSPVWGGRCQERLYWAAGSCTSWQEIFQTFIWGDQYKHTPGTPQTVIQVVDAIVVEVLRQRLDSEADNDGGDDDDHRDDDDDWQVEEVTAFRIFNTCCSLLDVIQDLALYHF